MKARKAFFKYAYKRGKTVFNGRGYYRWSEKNNCFTELYVDEATERLVPYSSTFSIERLLVENSEGWSVLKD